MGKKESMTSEIEKHHGPYFKADNKLCTHCAYKYRTMIFFVSNYTCTMIPNDQIWYLKQVKDEQPCNPSTVFRVRVCALFEWQNLSKVAVAFVFVLDAFARTIFCSRERPLWLSPERILSKVRAAFLLLINQQVLNFYALFLQKETCSLRLTVLRKAMHYSVSLLRLWSLEKNIQHNGQDRSHDFWNWEESWTVWQSSQILLIRNILHTNTYLWSSLCLIIPAPWFLMTKFYISSK